MAVKSSGEKLGSVSKTGLEEYLSLEYMEQMTFIKKLEDVDLLEEIKDIEKRRNNKMKFTAALGRLEELKVPA